MHSGGEITASYLEGEARREEGGSSHSNVKYSISYNTPPTTPTTTHLRAPTTPTLPMHPRAHYMIHAVHHRRGRPAPRMGKGICASGVRAIT